MPGINIQSNIETPPINPEQSPVSPEKKTSPEQKLEKAPEQLTEQAPATTQPTVVLPADNVAVSKPIVPQAVPPEKIEAIMSEGMDNLFLSMDVATQAQFKIKGEETAKEISTLLQQAKVKVRQVVDLVLAWLRIIPRVNKHFLEREAKIKAEKIIDLYKNKQ